MQNNDRKRLRQKQESFLFVLMGLILLGLLVSGYFLFVEKVLPGITSTKSAPGQPLENTVSGSSPGSGAVSIAGNAGEAGFPGESQEVALYFGARGKDTLFKETRRIPSEKMLLTLAGTLIKNLLLGPSHDTESRGILPPGTQLRSLFYQQGTFIVDFSREFVENHPGGALEEVLTIFSVVNTLTELDRKAKVKFLVNGLETETLRGHIGLRQVFSRNDTLIPGAP